MRTQTLIRPADPSWEIPSQVDILNVSPVTTCDITSLMYMQMHKYIIFVRKDQIM